jgi:branched-chain amino acid transport system substrate-binding protein
MLGFSLLVTGCGGGGDTVKIAVAGPITGSAAKFGEMIQNAAKLLEKQIKAAGGIEIDGKKYLVECEIFDDKGHADEAANVARQITSDDDILLVIGHFNSVCSNAAKVDYNRTGIVQFSPGSTNVDVCRDAPYTFRNLYRDDYQGDQIAIYLKESLGLNNAVVLFDNDDYGKGLMSSFKKRAGEIGLQCLKEIPYLRERTQDFKPLVQQAKEAGAEAIFIAGLYNEAALITRAAREDLQMRDVTIIGGDGVMSPDFISIAGASAEGALVTTPFLFNTGNDSDQAREFLATFKSAYRKEPDTWAALTYDALGMALEAVKAVGRDRKKIRDHLASIRDEESGYVGVTGVTYFDEEGDCYSKKVYVATVKNGQFVPAEKQMK